MDASLTLPLDRPAATRIARQVVGRLGWSLSEGPDGRLDVAEDPARLHCHCSPLHARLTLAGLEGSTTLSIAAEVPGWGPIATEHVRRQADLLARQIGLAASSAAGRASRAEEGA